MSGRRQRRIEIVAGEASSKYLRSKCFLEELVLIDFSKYIVTPSKLDQWYSAAVICAKQKSTLVVIIWEFFKAKRNPKSTFRDKASELDMSLAP